MRPYEITVNTQASLNLHRNFTTDFNEDSFRTAMNKYLVLVAHFQEEKKKKKEREQYVLSQSGAI